VIKEHAIPASGVAVDSLIDEDQMSSNRIDVQQYYGHGTSGEKLKLSYLIG